jgi:hypothetical protein
MAEKIQKKAYGVFQDALFAKKDNGSYEPIEMAKEGMNTLKRHATQLTVICTDSSIEDVENLLKKNDIPYDKVIKLDEKVDFFLYGKDNSVSVYSWLSALDNVSYNLAHEKSNDKSDQKKADDSFDRWLKKTVKSESVCPCG